MTIEFWVSLIVTAKGQMGEAERSLEANCTYIDNNVWIFEGDIGCLEEDGVLFNVIEEGAVPCLGDMSTKELVKLCEDIFGVDVYQQSFKGAKGNVHRART